MNGHNKVAVEYREDIPETPYITPLWAMLKSSLGNILIATVVATACGVLAVMEAKDGSAALAVAGTVVALGAALRAWACAWFLWRRYLVMAVNAGRVLMVEELVNETSRELRIDNEEALAMLDPDDLPSA